MELFTGDANIISILMLLLNQSYIIRMKPHKLLHIMDLDKGWYPSIGKYSPKRFNTVNL